MNWLLLLFSTHVASNPTEENRMLPQRDSFTNQNYLGPNASFIFEFNCEILNVSYCIKAKQELIRVGNLIATDILFRVPLKVKVSIVNDSSLGIDSRFTGSIQPPVGKCMLISRAANRWQ